MVALMGICGRGIEGLRGRGEEEDDEEEEEEDDEEEEEEEEETDADGRRGVEFFEGRPKSNLCFFFIKKYKWIFMF